jgi:hypothetical protein
VWRVPRSLTCAWNCIRSVSLSSVHTLSRLSSRTAAYRVRSVEPGVKGFRVKVRDLGLGRYLGFLLKVEG